MKVVLLIWYSNKNFCFRKIRSHLAPKIDFEIWKCPIFDGSSSNSLTRYKQILSGCSFVTKKLLNFAWLPMKFHNRGHITAHQCTLNFTPMIKAFPPSAENFHFFWRSHSAMAPVTTHQHGDKNCQKSLKIRHLFTNLTKIAKSLMT